MPRNATTDPDSGLRYYIWEGERMLSVTSLRKVIGMPFPLHNWVIKNTIRAAYEEGVTQGAIAGIGASILSTSMEQIIRKRSMGERDAAADKGTAIHAAVESGLAPHEVSDPALAPYIRHVMDARRVLGITPLIQEAQLWNRTLRYAGSLDMLGTVFTGTPEERLGIIDLKTGKGLYLDHLLQTLGYGMAEFVGKDDVIDPDATDLLHKVNGLYILHVTESGWEFIELAPDPGAWQAFQSMVRLANWLADHDTIRPFIAREYHGGTTL